MKGTLLVIILFSVSVCSVARANDFFKDTLPSDNSLITQLRSLNLLQYQGFPVDSMLAHLPSGISSMEIKPSIVLKHAQFLFVKYFDDVYVVISPSSFMYMNPDFVNSSTPTQNWNINLFRKESIGFVGIFNGSCINGCENKLRIN